MIGEGSFSFVFYGELEGQSCAIKVIKRGDVNEDALIK